MSAEDREKNKWNIAFEYQSIRNKYEAEYWKIILEHQRIQKIIDRFMLFDFVFFLLVGFYICFFC